MGVIEYNWTSVIAIIAALLSILGIVVIASFYYREYRTKAKLNSPGGIFNDNLNGVVLSKIRKAANEISKDPDKLINLCKRIINNGIAKKEDLYDVYGVYFNSDTNNYSFYEFLRAICASLSYTSFEDAGIKDEEANTIKNLINGFIDNEELKRDFDGISEVDKSSLLSINQMVKDTSNFAIIKSELKKLSFSLKDKQRRIRAEGIINRTALVVSLLSLIATIFSLFSTNSFITERITELKADTRDQVHKVIDAVNFSHEEGMNSKNDKDKMDKESK